MMSAAAMVERQTVPAFFPSSVPLQTTESLDDLHLAQVVCARLCHDLVGPAGAINIGLESTGGDTTLDPEAVALVAMSARVMAARLAFFRRAFGFNTGTEGITGDELRRLVATYLEQGRVQLQWYAVGGLGSEPARGARRLLAGSLVSMILCMVLVAGEALPRGGVLGVHIEEEGDRLHVGLNARGPSAGLTPRTLSQLCEPTADDLSPQSVHVCFARRLMALNDAVLSLVQKEGAEVVIQLEVSRSRARKGDGGLTLSA